MGAGDALLIICNMDEWGGRIMGPFPAHQHAIYTLRVRVPPIYFTDTRKYETQERGKTKRRPNMSSGYSRSCYLHNYQLQNLRRQAQIFGRSTLFTDEAPQMPLRIHPRNLGSHSTPLAFLTYLRLRFRLLLNNLGASYHLHPSHPT